MSFFLNAVQSYQGWELETQITSIKKLIYNLQLYRSSHPLEASKNYWTKTPNVICSTGTSKSAEYELHTEQSTLSCNSDWYLQFLLPARSLARLALFLEFAINLALLQKSYDMIQMYY